jgi:hypothetical protein
MQHIAAQSVDHSGPGAVELARRSGRAPACDAVRLLDEGDADPLRARGFRYGEKVRRVYSPTCSMAEDKRRSWLVGAMQVNVRLAVRSVDCERCHTGEIASSACRFGG